MNSPPQPLAIATAEPAIKERDNSISKGWTAMQQEVVGAACIVFVDLAPVALGDAAQMLRLPVAIFVERRKAVIPIKTIRAADPPGLKIERGSIPIASWSRMDLGVAAEEMERLSDNRPKREVFCGFSDPFLGRVYPTRVSQAGRNASRQNARPRLIGRSGAPLAARPSGPVATSQGRALGCRPRTQSRLWVDC